MCEKAVQLVQLCAYENNMVLWHCDNSFGTQATLN